MSGLKFTLKVCGPKKVILRPDSVLHIRSSVGNKFQPKLTILFVFFLPNLPKKGISGSKGKK